MSIRWKQYGNEAYCRIDTIWFLRITPKEKLFFWTLDEQTSCGVVRCSGWQRSFRAAKKKIIKMWKRSLKN